MDNEIKNETSNQKEIKGLFLLILAISGNFIAETLGCKTQKLLSENIYIKHCISLFILFFSITLFDDGIVKNPYDIFKKALSIYILFILFTRMNLQFTIIVFILLGLNYIIHLYIDYYDSLNNRNYIEKSEELNKIKNYIYAIIIVLILVGFILYFRKQYKEHYKNWSTAKFIFGVRKCNSLK
tara:strand:- start:28 stop:576 length:549 start_codon:yes stop_codon:yes gene_type:complete